MDQIKEFATALTALLSVVAGFLGLWQYFRFQTKRDRILQIRETFNAVVKSLSSDANVERMAGAILLRRFFDTKSEVGTAGIPYAKEAIDVSAAILRDQATGNFQKLLADGLAYAVHLRNGDLQKTNLQFAYLGSRIVDGEKVTTDLCHADFYRADLSMASLKDARACGATFYQARMHGTVLSGADLRNASFFEADLRGARFNGALLQGASFRSARNVPSELANKLDTERVYTGSAPFTAPSRASAAGDPRIFVSKPGCATQRQRECMTALLARVEAEMMSPQMLERSEYPQFGIFAEIQRIMSSCAGAVIFGFEELEIQKGVWRSGTPERRDVAERALSTPWNQIEAGMASILGLPLLVVSERRVAGGIFEMTSTERQLHTAHLEDDWNAEPFIRSFTDWAADVRERGRLTATTA